MAKPHLTTGCFAPVPLGDRFWSHVQKTETCWLWTGARQRQYGKVRVYDGHHRYRMIRAHRAVWELTNGPIPDGLCVCHHCDVPLCVRPDHLFLGTRTDNLADMTAKGRRVRSAAKLSIEVVRQIKAMHMKPGDQKLLAKQLGVCHATISLIRSGKNWKDI